MRTDTSLHIRPDTAVGLGKRENMDGSPYYVLSIGGDSTATLFLDPDALNRLRLALDSKTDIRLSVAVERLEQTVRHMMGALDDAALKLIQHGDNEAALKAGEAYNMGQDVL